MRSIQRPKNREGDEVLNGNISSQTENLVWTTAEDRNPPGAVVLVFVAAAAEEEEEEEEEEDSSCLLRGSFPFSQSLTNLNLSPRLLCQVQKNCHIKHLLHCESISR